MNSKVKSPLNIKLKTINVTPMAQRIKINALNFSPDQPSRAGLYVNQNVYDSPRS